MKKIVLILFLPGLLLSSCQDWLTITPKTSVVIENLLTSDEGAQQALAGVYLRMRYLYYPEGPMGGGGAGVIENAANSWTYPGNVDESSREYALMTHNWSHQDVETVNNNLFQNLFLIINNINPILIHIDDYQNYLGWDTYHIVKGEMLALRAYLMFDIMRLWGPSPEAVDPNRKYIPYPTEYTLDFYPYKTTEEIWEQLKKDTAEAEVLLSEYDPIVPENRASARFTSRQYYMNYYAALGLHARMALWFGDHETALEYARKVKTITENDPEETIHLASDADFMNWSDGTFASEHLAGISSTYLYDDYASMWKPGSPYLFIPLVYADVSQDLFHGNTDDLRLKNQWMYSAGYPQAGIPAYYTLRKYNNFYVSSTSARRFPLIRLAEMYFIIMESTGDLSEANAVYQEFCQARNIPFEPFTSLTEVKDAMLMLYIPEFHSEGQNFFTYKRFASPTQLWAPAGFYFTPESYVLPIPPDEFGYQQ